MSAFWGGEIFARSYLGLGTPPLSIAHPTIEYMFAPNQDLMRFGNHQFFNEYGMRSPPLANVTQPRRVLVLGDSVLNGGNLTDQARLATTLASDDQVFFGNASAGSWGPANMAAWLAQYGTIGADTVILVLSSHDLRDVPTFQPLDPSTHPTVAPLSALSEGATRYLPRYLPFLRAKAEEQDNAGDNLETGRAALENLLDALAGKGEKACLVLHSTQEELAGNPDPGHAEIMSRVSARDIPIVDLAGSAGRAENAFRDNIHLNDFGQELLAEALRDCARTAVHPHAKRAR